MSKLRPGEKFKAKKRKADDDEVNVSQPPEGEEPECADQVKCRGALDLVNAKCKAAAASAVDILSPALKVPRELNHLVK